MNVKQYLKQAYRLNDLINSDLKELSNLRDLSTSISSDMSQERVQSSKLKDKVCCIVTKIVDLENEISAEIDQFVDLKKEIRDAVNILSNRNEQLVLRLRYIEFLTWEQISERMSYSVKQVFRIHCKAMKNIAILKDDTVCP